MRQLRRTVWIPILIVHIPIWLFFLTIGIVPYLLGWIIVPLAVLCNAYKLTNANDTKPADGPIYHFTWKFMFLWDNSNDGIACRNYVDFFKLLPNYPKLAIYLQTVYWSCYRNPTNNMRITPFFSFKVNPDKIEFVGTFGDSTFAHNLTKYGAVPLHLNRYDQKVPQWFFCWHGLYSNFYWQFKVFGQLIRFWIGSGKLYPTMIYKTPDYLKGGTTAVIQLKMVA